MPNEHDAARYTPLRAFKEGVALLLIDTAHKWQVENAWLPPEAPAEDNPTCELSWRNGDYRNSIELRVGWDLTSGRYLIKDGVAHVSRIKNTEQNGFRSITRPLCEINAFSMMEAMPAVDNLFELVQKLEEELDGES
jgi:hypothetical protein